MLFLLDRNPYTNSIGDSFLVSLLFFPVNDSIDVPAGGIRKVLE